MDFLPDKINQYVDEASKPESPVLQQLNRETWQKIMMPQMLSGHVQGKLLSFFSQMISPSNILEIGTYTGYSAICLAQGLKENGRLYTIDINEELESMVRNYFDKSGLTDKIELMIGNAIEIIPQLNVEFDLVFIDADKVNYSRYYDLVFDKVKNGGFIIADNVLWSGKVTEPNPDKDTRAIMSFNEKVKNDSRVDNLLLPVRDGLMLIYKK